MFKEGWFDANERVRLYERRLLPEGAALANVVIILAHRAI